MIGERIGNFRLVSRLGRGGMGEVFLATHAELDTPAAVKLLNPEISENRDHVQRFFNEARIVSKIKHAGRVQIFDSGYHKGHAYLVMELLEGESLARRLERVGQLAIPEVLEVCGQIASVLDATQRAGVTHRDLKPDNIFIIKDHERPNGERVKILDFGIAKLSSGTMANLPKTSGTMGTPTYMAPEQWGDASTVDWRADVYSLGCVAFELLVGRPPFVCSSIPEAYAKHLTETPPLVRLLRPEVPLELEVLIAQLLAKQPERRATSLADVAARLSAIAAACSAPTQLAVTIVPAALAPPPPTLTTIGGSAAQIEARAARGSKPVWLGVAAAVVMIGAVAFVTAHHRSDGGTSTPTTIPAAAPSTAPAVSTATQVPAAPKPVVTAPLRPAPAPAPAAIAPSDPVPSAPRQRIAPPRIATHPKGPPPATTHRAPVPAAMHTSQPVAAANATPTASPSPSPPRPLPARAPHDAGKTIYMGTKGSILTNYPGN